MKLCRQIVTAAAVTAAMLLAPAQVLAGAAPTGPGAEPEAPAYSQEELARYEDNVLEYDEIAYRVRTHNPTIAPLWETYEDTKKDYQSMVTELESQYKVVKDMADSYISAGQLMGSAALVSSGRQLDKSYRQIVNGMRDAVKDWDTNKTATSTIRRYERQMIQGAQQAMIGYESILQNMDTLQTMVDLYQRQYDMYNRMQGLGLATGRDALGAYTSLLSARSQLASLQSQQDSIRRTLCELLGYDPDANPDIRPLPAFDMSRVLAMNLEEDTKKAIGNNYTLISQRTSAAGKTNAQIENRSRMLDEGDQKVTIEMQRLYQDVMDKKAAWEAASTGLAAAEAGFGAANRQYEYGLISEAQYIGLQLSYYQKKAAAGTAALSLWQAMETYDWGVAGFAAVE
ncbi:MAG: TolC family protein [Eubacteriales bacterium]|nr:TolC family protein [Eubacteriales bacterium]